MDGFVGAGLGKSGQPNKLTNGFSLTVSVFDHRFSTQSMDM